MEPKNKPAPMTPTVSVEDLVLKVGQLTMEIEWYKKQLNHKTGQAAHFEGLLASAVEANVALRAQLDVKGGELLPGTDTDGKCDGKPYDEVNVKLPPGKTVTYNGTELTGN